MLKHIFLVVAALFSLPLCGFSQNAVKVTPASGESTVFMLGDHPILTFGDAELTFSSDNESVTLDATQIHTFEFTTLSTTGLNDVNMSFGIVSLNGDVLSLSGFAPGSIVSVYNVNGTLVRDVTTGSDGGVDISLSGLPQGVYVLNSSQIQFKFRK